MHTGVDIEFIHPAAGTEKEAFQLMMGGELPDMILMASGNYYVGDLQAMYDDGLIIDLTPYLDEYAPQYKAVVDYSEKAQAQCYADGKALGFYKITYADKLPYQRLNIKKAWMEEAGIETEPQTIAEHEAYFQWVLDNKAVPPLTINISSISAMDMNILTGAFDFLYDWYVTKEDPTKVAYWANSPQYKEFLTLLNDWYNKGYLNKDGLSLSANEMKALFQSGNTGAIIVNVDENETNCPFMTKEKGQILGSNLADTPVGDGGEWVSVVTSACKNPEVAVQYLNYCYTYEGSLIPNWSVEGEGWNWNDKNFPEYTDLLNNNPQGMTHSNVSYAVKIHFNSKYCYPDDITSVSMLYNPLNLETRIKWKHLGTEQSWLQLPPVKLTDTEVAERADIMAQVDTFAKEMLIKFVTGAEPLDNFDAYVKSIEEYGLLDAIEITQGAVDRYYGK